jgi:hypothetical protein
MLQRQLQDLFATGCFKLHKWDSNSTEVLNSIPQEIRSSQTTSKLGDSDNFVNKTLGIECNSNQDYFRFNFYC